jgi:hypothetical protein
MEDLGFKGTGSQFVTRFKAGEDISAEQLNRLANAVQTSISMPYLGDGPSISFTGGGTTITTNPIFNQTTLYPWSIAVTKVGSQYRFTCRAGTINGLIPTIGGVGPSKLLTATNPQPYDQLTFDGDGNCWVYLRAGPKSGTTKYWPNNNLGEASYPSILPSASILTDTDDFGYILLAMVTKASGTESINITQFVFNSVWSQRNKYTLPNSAMYFYWPM